MLVLLMEGLMKCAVDKGSGGMIYVSRSKTIGSGT
jgi:hypothetical protein